MRHGAFGARMTEGRGKTHRIQWNVEKEMDCPDDEMGRESFDGQGIHTLRPLDRFLSLVHPC